MKPFGKESLLKSVLYAKNYTQLILSQRRAIFKLLEEKGKGKRYIKNWRPISSFNFDAKMLLKTLASKLKVGPSPSKKICYICFNVIMKNDEKCFLFHPKFTLSSFRS